MLSVVMLNVVMLNVVMVNVVAPMKLHSSYAHQLFSGDKDIVIESR